MRTKEKLSQVFWETVFKETSKNVFLNLLRTCGYFQRSCNDGKKKVPHGTWQEKIHVHSQGTKQFNKLEWCKEAFTSAHQSGGKLTEFLLFYIFYALHDTN